MSFKIVSFACFVIVVVYLSWKYDTYHGLELPQDMSYLQLVKYPVLKRILAVRNGLATYLRLEQPSREILNQLQAIFRQVDSRTHPLDINRPLLPPDFVHNLNHIIDRCRANKEALNRAWSDGVYLMTALFLVYDYIDQHKRPPPLQPIKKTQTQRLIDIINAQ